MVHPCRCTSLLSRSLVFSVPRENHGSCAMNSENAQVVQLYYDYSLNSEKSVVHVLIM